MSLQASGGDIPAENPKLRLPDMEEPANLTTGGVYVPIKIGRVRTVHGLTEKVKRIVKDGLGEDFAGSIRIGAIRGVTPGKVNRLLLFALPNGIGGHDVHIDIPRNRE